MMVPLSTRKTRSPILLAAVLAFAALAGCSGADANGNLFVKDAPTDELREVHVTFTKAQVQAASGSWDTVFDGKETIDLLALSDAGAREKLASFDIPEGEYLGLRIFVSEVRVVDLAGAQRSLNVFGNIVQVADSFTVGPDGIDILVDFDLDEGLDLSSGTYTPVVRDVQTSDDDADHDGKDDVEDRDDDSDGREDDEDDDADGDDEDDGPQQRNFDDVAALCANEAEEERLEALEERDEALAEAADERNATLGDADATPAERSGANATYQEQVADIEADYQKDLQEADNETAECLTRDGEDREDDDDEDDAEHAGEDEDDSEGGESSSATSDD